MYEAATGGERSMEASSVGKRRKGRYLKAEQRRKKKRTRNMIIASVIAVVCVSVLLIFLLPQKSVYRTLCGDGYTGMQEQLIASLIGEEIAPLGDSAYAMAVKNGYRKTETDWIETLTGAQKTDASKSTYQIACANGFEGDLTQR